MCMLKGINKQLIRRVFPDSEFLRIDKAIVNLPYICAYSGEWVWSDGRGKTYCRIGVMLAEYSGSGSDTVEALLEVGLYLDQLNR